MSPVLSRHGARCPHHCHALPQGALLVLRSGPLALTRGTAMPACYVPVYTILLHNCLCLYKKSVKPGDRSWEWVSFYWFSLRDWPSPRPKGSLLERVSLPWAEQGNAYVEGRLCAGCSSKSSVSMHLILRGRDGYCSHFAEETTEALKVKWPALGHTACKLYVTLATSHGSVPSTCALACRTLHRGTEPRPHVWPRTSFRRGLAPTTHSSLCSSYLLLLGQVVLQILSSSPLCL